MKTIDTPIRFGHTDSSVAAPESHGEIPVTLLGMSPANFGMVMATGFVSLAVHALGYSSVATWLLWLSNGMYGILFWA